MLEPSRRNFLNGRLDYYSMAQPELKLLSQRLLDIAGEMIVPREEIHLSELLSYGRVFDFKKIITIAGDRNECHENAKQYAQDAANATFATGWILSREDNLWRQHSWCWVADRNVIIETTIPGSIYFGILASDFINSWFKPRIDLVEMPEQLIADYIDRIKNNIPKYKGTPCGKALELELKSILSQLASQTKGEMNV